MYRVCVCVYVCVCMDGEPGPHSLFTCMLVYVCVRARVHARACVRACVCIRIARTRLSTLYYTFTAASWKKKHLKVLKIKTLSIYCDGHRPGRDGLPVSLVFSLVFSLMILLRHVLENSQDGLPVIKECMYGITVRVVDNPV